MSSGFSNSVYCYPYLSPLRLVFTVTQTTLIRSFHFFSQLSKYLSSNLSITFHIYPNISPPIFPLLFTFIQISLLQSFHYFSHLSRYLSSDLSITVYSYLGIFPLIFSILFTVIQTPLVWSLHYSLHLSTYLSSNLAISVHIISPIILPLPFTSYPPFYSTLLI